MDQEIVERIRNEEEQGLILLKQAYAGLIFYIVSGMLKDQGEIEECISDIHFKVWHSIDRFDPGKSRFSTWLTAVSRNTAIIYLRRKSFDNNELKDEIADSYSLENHVMKRERSQELSHTISSLTVKEQQIFRRKYYYLQQLAQIATEMGLTERFVEGMLYRIQIKLQQRLGGDFI